MNGDPVTRDALRADLGELELRLVREIAKAVAPMNNTLEGMQRGEFNQAQTLTVEAIAEKVIEKKTSVSWTKGSRVMAVLGVVIAFASMCAAVTVALVTIYA